MTDALADLLDEAPTRFELEQLAVASPSLTANTPGIPVFPGGIAPAANSYTLAGCCRAALVRGLSSPELYATALMAAETAISTARRFGGEVPEAIGTSEGLFSATIGIGGIDTAEIGVNCVDSRSDGGVLIEGAAYPIAGRRSRVGASRSGTSVHMTAARPYHQGNIHSAAASPRRSPLRSCAMEHIVLEYDESTRTALVVATSNKREPVLSGHASPYIVADGYDFESRSWGAGHYFTDIAAAKIDYERSCRHSYPLAEGRLHDDEVIACRWRRGDIAGVLEESLDYPIPATKENIDTAIGQIAHVQDRLIEDGWREIADSIRKERLGLGLGSSQADNFYRGVYDVTAHHNSMFWPSGDGSAVHVSHCRLGDGPSFGLTVRTIPAAAIGDEPVTFEKIDRLGGKIELCVDNIGQDIEKVRAFAGSSPVVRAFVEPLCAYIPAPSDSVGEQKRDISSYLRQTAQRCQRISHPIDPDESASSARCATFGGAAALPAHRGYKHR